MIAEKQAHAKHERSNDHLVEQVRPRVPCVVECPRGSAHMVSEAVSRGSERSGRRAYVVRSEATAAAPHPQACSDEALSPTSQEKKKLQEAKREKARQVFHERYANAQAAAFVQQQVRNTSFYLLERGAGIPDPGMPNAR